MTFEGRPRQAKSAVALLSDGKKAIERKEETKIKDGKSCKNELGIFLIASVLDGDQLTVVQSVHLVWVQFWHSVSVCMFCLKH